MKKVLLSLFFIFVMLISGCTAPPAPVPTETPSPTETPEPVYVETKTRNIAIMIDNDNKDARPHAGIEDAHLIYEMYVEGSATRMMALFKDVTTEKIGPVRSSRHYFLDYALENDAIYVHFGWSPKAQNDIKSLGVNNINGVMGGDGNIFWRERKHKYDWHSAYTSIEKISEYAKNTKGYRDTSDVSGYKKNGVDKEIIGTDVSKITIPYAGFYNVSYEYDAETNTYKRYINGESHATQAGVHLAPKNIIIQRANNFNLSGDSSGRQDIQTTGSGEGVYITGGKYANITWSKSSRNARTVYKLENGEEIVLNPGQTWIQIVPPSMTVTME